MFVFVCVGNEGGVGVGAVSLVSGYLHKKKIRVYVCTRGCKLLRV